MSGHNRNTVENFENKLEDIEERMDIIKKLTKELEAKDRYILQNIENSIDYLKILKNLLKKKKALSMEEWKEGLFLDAVAEFTEELFKKTQFHHPTHIDNQLEKLKTICSILKE